MKDNKRSEGGGSSAVASAARTMTPRIQSTDLLQGNRQVVIVHGDDEYRLQQTSSGKLILTK